MSQLTTMQHADSPAINIKFARVILLIFSWSLSIPKFSILNYATEIA